MSHWRWYRLTSFCIPIVEYQAQPHYLHSSVMNFQIKNLSSRIFCCEFEDIVLYYFIYLGITLKVGTSMGVSYSKLFKLLIDKKMKNKDLISAAGISSSTMAKLGKDEYVNVEVLVKICNAVDANIGDIMDVIPD